jgi:hypothetical protein
MSVTLNFKTQLMVDKLLAHAKLIMEEQGGLAPVAFIGTNDGKIGMIMPSSMNDQDEKEAFAQAIREVSKEHKADFVVIFLESWLRVAKSQKEHDKFVKSGKRISEMPDKKEVVFVSVETHDGNFTGHGEIHTDASGKKTFDTPELENTEKTDGIFTGLLAA